jgi:N-acyl homoserine lactone hydrolase
MFLQGRPIALYVLDLGTFAVRAGRVIGIPGFLVVTDRQERVLVDTGFRDAYAADADAAGRQDGLTAFGALTGFGPQNLVRAQLERIGLSPADISLLILTHTHVDHVGGLGHFTHVPVVIGAGERALPKPLYWRDCQPMEWPLAEWRTVHEDTDIGPHLTVLHVPGHTAGQLALRLDLPKTGRVILMSDAISRPSEPQEGFPDADFPDQAQIHAARLMAMPADLRIFGHCPEQWTTLVKAPDYYA